MNMPLFNKTLLEKIPDNIRLGCSTWTYRGWEGLVYHKNYKNEKDFKQNSLAEYAAFPYFRAVGIDHAYYRPPSKEQLASYAAQLPHDFRWCVKVWERITIPHYPKHARYGQMAGKQNPDFLNADLFHDAVLANFTDAHITEKTGVFIFQFSPIHKNILRDLKFFKQLNKFFESLPKDFRYAVELRNPALINKEYFDLLNQHNVTHCFNHWNYMPPLREQMIRAASAGGLKAPHLLMRLLTPLGTDYQGAVKRFKPYDRMQAPNATMRHDAVSFIKRAIKKKADTFIIVNNRAEGNAPLTIDAILNLL